MEVRKAAEQLRIDTRVVVGRECPVPRPNGGGLRQMGGQCSRYALQRRVPSGAAERVFTPIAHQRVQQPPGVIEHFTGGLAANAQKAATVRIASHADDLVLLALDEHPAQRRMAVHWAHRARGRHRGLRENCFRCDRAPK